MVITCAKYNIILETLSSTNDFAEQNLYSYIILHREIFKIKHGKLAWHSH